MTLRVTAVVAVAALVASACAAGASASTTLTVFGAASLKASLDAIKTAYEAATPGTTLTISTDSSAALATQIEQGAPADVFLSADTANPQRLVDAGLTAGTPVAFAGNELAIVVPADNPAGIETPADLATDGLRIVAAGDEVPITKYASQLVANLAAEAGYPEDFEAGYAANVVSREDNVSAVVAKVGLGEGDAGIVYVTDAAAADGVTTIKVADAANVRAAYSGIVIGASPHRDAAAAFLEWLAGTHGQAVLGEFGFLSPP